MLVRELLEFHSFVKEAELIAGHQGLGNQISDITVMEAPDFPSWVNGGELVLSTFFSIKGDIQKQVDIVEQLSHQGVAALGVKIGRYIDYLDIQVIEAANRQGLPLFAINKDSKFRNIIRLVSEQIIHIPDDYTQGIIQFHDRLMNIANKGVSPKVLCDEITKHIGYQCALYTEGHEKIIGNIEGDPVINNEGTYNNAKFSEKIDKLLDEFALNNQLGKGNAQEYRSGSYVVVGCSIKEELTNILIFSGVNQWRNYESMLARVAANAISAHFLEDHIQRNVEKRMKSNFVDEILMKGVEPEEFVKRAEFFGWTLYNRFQAIIVRLDHVKDLTQQAFHLLADRWQYQLNEVFPSVLSIVRKDEFIALLSIPSNSSFNDINFHRNLIEEILAKIFYKSPLKKKVKIGVGYMFDNPVHIKDSYRQARDLIKINGNKDKCIYYSSEHLLELLLLQSKGTTEFKLLRMNILEPIEVYDKKNGTELLKTLQYVLDTESLDEAANKLFVHTNTLRKRLKKVEEITKVDLLNIQGRLLWTTLLLLHK